MYSKLFTLTDLFKNNELKGYLPQLSVKTNSRGYSTINFKNNYIDEILMYAKMGAMPHMKNITMGWDYSVGGEAFYVKGEIRKHATIQTAYEGVLTTLRNASGSISLLASYGDTIVDVMKKIRKSNEFKANGYEPKLYLRITSLEEIKSMGNREREALLKNIVENIYFSDDFKPYREPTMERHSFIVNNRNVLMGYDVLKRKFDRKVRY